MKSFLDFGKQLNEVLSKDSDIGTWISDFVHSDDPKFKGKSKAERMEMAKGAYYAAQRNEGVKQPNGTDKISEEFHVVGNNSYYGDKQHPIKLSSHKSKDEADAALAKHKADSKKGGNTTRWHKVVDDSGLKRHMKEETVTESAADVEFRIDHRDKPKGDVKATLNSHEAKHSFTSDKATYVHVPWHKADSFKSAMKKQHGVSVEINEETLDEISKDTLSSYANKAFAHGNELHYDIDHTNDKDEKAKLKAKLSKRNDGVIKASQKMNKEDMDEAVDTVKKDASGKVIAWSHEGDWEKMSTKKQGQGKAANLAGKALQQTKKLAKEEVELDEKAAAGDWHVHDSKSGKIHSTYDSHRKAINAMNKLNKQHDGYETPGGITQSKFSASAASYHKEEVELDEAAWGKDKVANLRQAHDRHMEKALAANKAGDDVAVKTHQRKMQMIQGKLQKLKQNEEVELGEECEILAELDKKTLGSYVKKAADDYSRRETRISRALDKNLLDPNVDRAVAKQDKRKVGMHKAIDKLTKEEVEELDELDKKTLGNYVKKSHDQLMKHTASVNMKYGRGDKDATAYALDKDALRKTANRTQGMKTAISKLTKEEAEQIEESSVTVWSHPSKPVEARWNKGAAYSVHVGNQVTTHHSKEAAIAAAKRKAAALKEQFDDNGNLVENMLTYTQFMQQLDEIKADDIKDRLQAKKDADWWGDHDKAEKKSPVRKVQGHSYGAGEEEGEDDEEGTKKVAKPDAVKRGRGRPAGSKSGARI